ncbi:MAG: D-glycero-beta-D-manno-heptose-7-phosphate kinase [bacterium]|nr:D-glycero-beta-D-manno-heptose-7-phosphate kinase [bacterium]
MIIEQERLSEITERFKDKRILVIGDLILDEFIWGKVSRISPEAPVPVVEVQKESLRLGGSANVVNNLSSLGCRVALSGVIGNDDNGKRLISILEKMNVDYKGVVIKENRPTAIKTRVIAQHQQIVRFDREKTMPVMKSTIEKITDYVMKNLSSMDAVIISDYGKGVITEELLSGILPKISRKNIPVAVDPKPLNFTSYQGVTVITPNHHEAAEAAGMATETDEDLKKAGARLLESNRSKSILITRGENGMSLFEQDGKETHIPTVARDVYDVTGAGDTVISTMALSLASGATLREAAILANHAAGIVVGKLGTATTTVDEIKSAITKESMREL